MRRNVVRENRRKYFNIYTVYVLLDRNAQFKIWWGGL